MKKEKVDLERDYVIAKVAIILLFILLGLFLISVFFGDYYFQQLQECQDRCEEQLIRIPQVRLDFEDLEESVWLDCGFTQLVEVDGFRMPQLLYCKTNLQELNLNLIKNQLETEDTSTGPQPVRECVKWQEITLDSIADLDRSYLKQQGYSNEEIFEMQKNFSKVVVGTSKICSCYSDEFCVEVN